MAERDLLEIVHAMEIVEVPKDHLVVGIGDMERNLFVVLDGKVEIQGPDPLCAEEFELIQKQVRDKK